MTTPNISDNLRQTASAEDSHSTSRLKNQLAETKLRFDQRIAKSRELQERIAQLSEEMGTIDTRREECLNRLKALCRDGRRPADEALAEFDQHLDRLAGEGKERLDRLLDDFTRPRHRNPAAWQNERAAPHIGTVFRRSPNGCVTPDPVFAHLLYDALKSRGHAVIEAACADTDLPSEDDRDNEVRDLGKEAEKLKAEKAELQAQVDGLMKRLQNLLQPKPRGAGVYTG